MEVITETGKNLTENITESIQGYADYLCGLQGPEKIDPTTSHALLFSAWSANNAFKLGQIVEIQSQNEVPSLQLLGAYADNLAKTSYIRQYLTFTRRYGDKTARIGDGITELTNWYKHLQKLAISQPNLLETFIDISLRPNGALHDRSLLTERYVGMHVINRISSDLPQYPPTKFDLLARYQMNTPQQGRQPNISPNGISHRLTLECQNLIKNGIAYIGNQSGNPQLYLSNPDILTIARDAVDILAPNEEQIKEMNANPATLEELKNAISSYLEARANPASGSK
jgi:hypothetical protein